MKIKKIDINSILPIIIKIIKLIFDDVSKFEKLIFCKLYISELAVLVKVKIDSLKDFSKPISSKINKPDKIKRLKKKDIKIKNDTLIWSSVILISELNIDLLIILLGLTSFKISYDT